MNKSREFILIYLTLIFLFLPSFLSAQIYDNIGFKKDVPEEVRKACSMCDEFLDVQWIDEKRYIGKLRTEWYKNGEKQGILYLLVKLEEPGSEEMLRRGNGVFYGISGKEYYSKEFENFMKKAELAYGKGLFFIYAMKGNKKEKFLQETMPNEFERWSYANFSKTICILYPKERYVYFLETKQPFNEKNLSEGIKKNFENILKLTTERCNSLGKISIIEEGYDRYECNLSQIKYSKAIDINSDFLEDYIFRFWINKYSIKVQAGPNVKRIGILFSKQGKYEFKDISECSGETTIHEVLYGMVQEKEIYIGKCNLTKITKGGK